MGLDDALIFTRVVECHSFTLAAQLLGMQKSTVSRRLALLEERLGVRLINRTTRKLRLTEVGQAYYERCRQIMLDFAEAEQAVMQLQEAPSGLLRITAPIEFGQMLLGRVIGTFVKTYPEINAEVEITSRTVDLVEEGVDIAIRVGLPQDSTVIARKLYEASRHLYASPAYLAQYGTPLTIEGLAGHRGILLSQDSPKHWPLIGSHISCQRVLSSNNVTFSREAAVSGGGIAVLPSVIGDVGVQRGELVKILPQARLSSSEIYAVYLSRRFQALKVKTFLDFLIAQLPAEERRLLEPNRLELYHSPTALAAHGN